MSSLVPIASFRHKRKAKKCSGDELGAGEDITDLACHVALQSHVIKGSSNFMSGSSLWYITTLARLVAIGIVLIEICF